MGIFFIYSLKTALCLIAFYLLYKVALSRDTFHSLNRGVLLGLMAVSLVLPLVHVSSGFSPIEIDGMARIEGMIEARVVEDAVATDALTLTQMLFAIYIIGVIFFTARELWSLISLSAVMRRGPCMDAGDGVRLIVVRGDVSPFSWFGNVIISEKDYEENPREIIIHEKAHIAHGHSVDVLLCNLLIIFQWFNPAAWLIKAELQNVHEYEADDAVLSQGVDASAYQLLLIRKAVGDRLYSMANNLNHSSLKKRIKMMLKKKSNPWSRAKILLTVPVAAAAVTAFAIPVVENTADEMKAESDKLVASVVKEVETVSSEPAATVVEPAKEINPEPVVAPEQKEEAAPVKGAAASVKEETAPVEEENVPDDDKVNEAPEVQPKYPGGMGALKKFLTDNIKYPQEAFKARKQGTVIVQFVVYEDGHVGNANVVKGVSPELNAEAVRVIGLMPNWESGMIKGKPVKVRYTLPVKFSLKK